jgi:hypothetical protein
VEDLRDDLDTLSVRHHRLVLPSNVKVTLVELAISVSIRKPQRIKTQIGETHAVGGYPQAHDAD